VCPDLPTHLLCATLQIPQYASIHSERRLHNPKPFVFIQNITLLPHLFVDAIPIAQPPRSGLLQIAVSTMLRVGLHAPRNSLLPEHCRYSPIDFRFPDTYPDRSYLGAQVVTVIAEDVQAKLKACSFGCAQSRWITQWARHDEHERFPVGTHNLMERESVLLRQR
jgi:hypothetical protein